MNRATNGGNSNDAPVRQWASRRVGYRSVAVQVLSVGRNSAERSNGELGFFDAKNRLSSLSKKGDPPEIAALVPWEGLRADIETVVLTPEEAKKSNAAASCSMRSPCSGC
jgi:hypothetical protein